MKYLSLALSLLPGILQGVLAVETALAGAKGETKKQAILTAVDAAAKAGEAIPEQHVQVISGLIDGVVGVFNQSGVFTHATPPATA